MTDSDTLILKAARIAQGAHARQNRKYGGGPYIVHPARVAARTMLLEDVTAEAVAAAWLHDVLEDCGWSADELKQAGMPEETIRLVVELTNVSKQFPDLPRRKRKAMDHQRLAAVSRMAKRIKMIDRIDNLRDMANADDRFKSLYVAESVQLVSIIAEADTELAEELYQTIERMGFSRDHQDVRAAE